jgi:hypothetical protein
MPSQRIPTTVLLVLLSTSAAAQELRWNLPPRGAAIYRRDLKVDRQVEPPGGAMSQPWYGEANAAVVLAGELDDKQQHSTEPLCDLRDALAHLALDLGATKAGKTTLAIDGGGRFQPLQFEITFTAPGPDGSQEIRASIATAKGAPATPTGPTTPKITGQLQGKRTLDRANGRVASLEGQIELTADHPAYASGTYSQPARKVRFTIRDRWTFDRLLSPADAEFRTMVADGIRRATEALHRQLQTTLNRKQNPASNPAADPHHDSQPGELGLLLLALLKGGTDVRDPLLQQGYDELRKRDIQGTYSLACALLAVEALYTPASEWQELRAGRLKAPMARQPSEVDRAGLAAWLQTLMGNIDTTVDAAYLRRWHYGPSTSFDNSNTQYALLGVYAADLCGAEISPQVWTAAGNHWLQVKVAAGAAGAPQLVTHTDLERAQQGKGTRARSGTAPMVGWAYGGSGAPTGSMTCAGITGITLCTAALRADKKGNPQLLRELDAAARGGFLWLEKNLSVRRNPGPPGSWTNWYYYYLYGLERTCELNQVALLGDRDWYFEGAMQLLGQQRADGSWGASHDSCFALLFLKKSALPAITHR